MTIRPAGDYASHCTSAASTTIERGPFLCIGHNGASSRLFIDIQYWVGNVADTTLAPLFSPVYPGPILG